MCLVAFLTFAKQLASSRTYAGLDRLHPSYNQGGLLSLGHHRLRLCSSLHRMPRKNSFAPEQGFHGQSCRLRYLLREYCPLLVAREQHFCSKGGKVVRLWFYEFVFQLSFIALSPHPSQSLHSLNPVQFEALAFSRHISGHPKTSSILRVGNPSHQ